MIIRTASYFTYTGPGRVSISRSVPKGTAFDGIPTCRPLVPDLALQGLTEAAYRRRYGKVLDNLDPAAVAAVLKMLAGDADPVLLCWERPPFTEVNFCHRRMVAGWLQDALGIEVPEIEPAPRKAPADPKGMDQLRQQVLFGFGAGGAR